MLCPGSPCLLPRWKTPLHRGIPTARPDRRFARLAGVNLNPLGHDEGGIKAHTELANKLRVLLLIAGEILHECRCTGLGNGPEMLDHLVAVHADTVVTDGDRIGVLCHIHLIW